MRERERVWIWMGGKVGRRWEEWSLVRTSVKMGKQPPSWLRFFFAVSAVFCLRPNALILHCTFSFLRLTFTTPTAHTVVPSREGIQNPFSTQKAGAYQLSNLVTFALSVWQRFSSTRFSFRPIFFPRLIFNTYLYRICKEFQCSHV